MLWSFLYLILGRFFQFLVLLGRGHRAREIKILALRHQVAVLCRQVSRPDAFFMTPATLLRWNRDWSPGSGPTRRNVRAARRHNGDRVLLAALLPLEYSIGWLTCTVANRLDLASGERDRLALGGQRAPRVHRPAPDHRERHLPKVPGEYERHCNQRRPHRSRDRQPPQPAVAAATLDRVRLKREEVLSV